MPNDIETVRSVLEASAADLLARANVVAAGIGYKLSSGERTSDLCVVVSVAEKVEAAGLRPSDRIPPLLDGVPTDVLQTGRIRALQARTGRHRPAPGGVSIGHRDITAGTLGCLVRKNGDLLILSNNHVLANSNEASRSDAILQPGAVDGGQWPRDHLADLEDFVPIQFRQPEPPSPCTTARAVIAFLNAVCRTIRSKTRYQAITLQVEDNLVDAAVARPLSPADVVDEILEIGTIQGVGDAELGTSLKKSGRTTELTTGEVLQTDVTVDVDYGGGRTARFVDQLMAGPMSQGGDSGSAVLDDENNLVGLLFAGSDSTTIMNRISHVFSQLDVSR